MEFVFTLRYQIPDGSGEMDELVERLGEVGCTDALVGIGLPGRVSLEFIREAESAGSAVQSALADVKKAVPSARLIEAVPDLAGLSDVAEIVRISRQCVRKLMVTHFSVFPAPVHEGKPSVWHLADLLGWFSEREGYSVDQCTLEVARVARQVNIARELGHLEVAGVSETELKSKFQAAVV